MYLNSNEHELTSEAEQMIQKLKEDYFFEFVQEDLNALH